MDHQEAKDLFTSYHDGELEENLRLELEQHLKTCPACSSEWEVYQKLMNEVSGLMSIAPPKDVARAVEHKIHRRSRGKFFGRGKNANIQFALISFILVLLFMVAYLMLTAVNEIVLLDGKDESSQEKNTPAASSVRE